MEGSTILLSRVLARLIQQGELRLIDARGRRHAFGRGTTEQALAIRLHNRRIERRLIVNPMLALGEGYMDGEFSVEGGDIHDLLRLLTLNMGRDHTFSLFRSLTVVRTLMRRIQQHNPIRWASAHVAHHYDLSGEFYDLFLDADKQYSCAYYEREEMTLEEAQQAKQRRLACKLDLKAEHHLLDVGCGWGGLALYLARASGARVTGVTLSKEQYAAANSRAANERVADQVGFQLQDYRQLTGLFDRIVSVGMFEHVGVNHYLEYFRKLRSLLSANGIALVHAIGRSNPPTLTNAWTRKYIFPGGYVPALSEVLRAVEKSGLWVTDVEILRLHYAKTLAAWRQRFLLNRVRIAEIYDERFCRMWEYYLSGSELTFIHGDLMVFQIQLTKRIDTVPITRDYMYR